MSAGQQPPGTKPTLWIDSNVTAEVMSQGDIYADMHRGPFLIQQRRLNLQGSLWLATVLDEQRAVTVSYLHEVLRTIEKRAPPGSAAGVWTWVWAACLSPYVFNRWRGEFTEQGKELKESDERDQLMVDLCKADGLTLISRDTGARKRARRAGLTPMTPEEYAVNFMAFAVARDRFFARFTRGAQHYVVDGPRVEWKARAESMNNSWDVYQNIWAPAGDVRGPFGSVLTSRASRGSRGSR